MTRQLSRNYSLSVVAAFFAILALLMAAAVLAQGTGAGQASGKPYVAPAAGDVNAPSQALERPMLSGGGNAERAPVSRLRTKRHGAGPLDENPPLFLPVVTYGTAGSYAEGVAVADVNSDGKPDLLVATFAYSTFVNVSVLIGNGDGTFQQPVGYDTGGIDAQAVAVVDVNSDGKPDLVVADRCGGGCVNGTVGVLLGYGDGTFQPAMNYSSGGGVAWSVAIADLNGDSRPDVVVANVDSKTLGVLLGNGDGTFQSVVTYGSGGLVAWSVAVADLNGDGRPDLITESCCEINGDRDAAVLLGNGDGTFQPPVAYDSGGQYAFSVAVADVNGDGKPDLLVANGMLGVLLGNGDGTFQTAVTYDSGDIPSRSVAVGDVNRDGKLDVALANSGPASVLLGNGDGSFHLVGAYGSVGWATSPQSAAVADLNGDGWPDLIVSDGFSNNVGVLMNNMGPHGPTNTALASSVNPAGVRQVVTYTATVTDQNGGAVTGTVTFNDGGAAIATVRLAGGQAAYSAKYKTPGTHTITATYSGDADNTGSISAPLTEYIRGASKTVLTTSGSPSHVGQPVTLTATVTSQYGAIPDGELVTFYDGTTAIGTGATASGAATFTTSSLTAKTHTIKATYVGDATFKPSTGRVTQVVVKYPTTTALSSVPNPSAHGQAVTFTATVTPTGPYPLTGKVVFEDGTTWIGAATLSGGVATITKSKLAVGTHPITAQYLGDVASAKSTSSVLDQVVQ